MLLAAWWLLEFHGLTVEVFVGLGVLYGAYLGELVAHPSPSLLLLDSLLFAEALDSLRARDVAETEELKP